MADICVSLAFSQQNNYKCPCLNGRGRKGDKKWGILILKILAILILTVCTGMVIFIIASAIINNLEKIIITIGSVGCITAIFLNFFKKKEPAPALPDNSIIEYDPISLESTYKILRQNLCSVIGDTAEITKLRKPVTLSQMDAPTHFDIVSKCAIYHFLVLKLAEEIDPFTITGILQNAIEQRLNNNEAEGITQTSFFYNGQVYPSIMVDRVQDLGNYIQVDVAIASEYYCKYRERRIYNNMAQSNSGRPQDKYF